MEAKRLQGKGRIKDKNSGLAISKRNVIHTSDKDRLIDYALVSLFAQIGFWDVHSLLDNGINCLQNATFLQPEQTFQGFKPGIVGLNKVT